MSWSVVTLNETVEEEILSLPMDMRAKFVRISNMICEFGLHEVGMPHVRPIQGKLWEMRMKGKDGIARALYVVATGKKVVVVRAFVKKTQKTPSQEIRLALERAKEIES
jgi:phage-related protein